jgi:hypothetical protein
LFAHDIRVLMIVSLQPLSFRFGVFTPHGRSISRIRRLSERAYWSSFGGRRMPRERRLGLPVERSLLDQRLSAFRRGAH